MRQVLVSDMLADKAQQVADSLGRGTVVVSMDDVNAGAQSLLLPLKILTAMSSIAASAFAVTLSWFLVCYCPEVSTYPPSQGGWMWTYLQMLPQSA